jgi:hypothetical protein
MADQESAMYGVGFCFRKVKDLIESLPKEYSFGKDPTLMKKKEAADAALEVLEKFFNTLSTVDQHKVKRFAQFCNEFPNFTTNLDGITEMLSFACGVKHPTINIIEEPDLST